MQDFLTNLLLVEDNEDDVFFMRRALRAAKLSSPLQVVTDGQSAIDYIKGSGIYGDRISYPFPTLVFLDLKLPYLHGFEVLSWIREESSVPDLPVVVLTSSAEEKDRRRAEKFRAAGYMVKPPETQELHELFRKLTLPLPASISASTFDLPPGLSRLNPGSRTSQVVEGSNLC